MLDKIQMNELSFYYTNKKGGNMILIGNMDRKYGHEITRMACDACRKALNNNKDIIDGIQNLIQMNVEYKLLEHLDNSIILEPYDSRSSTKQRSRNCDFKPITMTDNLKCHLQELLDEEAERYLLEMQNDYIYQRRILKTTFFDDDDDRTNNFIRELSHVFRSTDLMELIDKEIGFNRIGSEFERRLPQFVDIIMYFLEGNGTEINRDPLRRLLQYHINVQPYE